MTRATADYELKVRPSSKRDALPLCRSLRHADLQELSVLSHSEEQRLQSIQRGIKLSDPCYTIHLGGRPVGVFGAIPGIIRGNPVGVCWLLGSNDLVYPLSNKSQFIRKSSQWLNVLHERYPTLWNLIDSRNTVHLRWVQWLGFEISNAIELGSERIVFYEIMRKS